MCPGVDERLREADISSHRITCSDAASGDQAPLGIQVGQQESVACDIATNNGDRRHGIVNFAAARRENDSIGHRRSYARDLRPQAHRRCAQIAVMACSDVVAWNVEQIGDRIVNGDEALQLSLRLEAFHDPLASSDRLVGIFRTIVEAFMGAVFALPPYLP
jgi:hypothetical protein